MSDAVVHTVLRRWPVYVRYMLFPLLLLTHAPSTAHSQQLATGDTIRVRPSQSTEAGRQWTDATVDRLTPDTLWYQSRGTVSPMSVDNADIQRPTLRDHRLRGASAREAHPWLLAMRSPDDCTLVAVHAEEGREGAPYRALFFLFGLTLPSGKRIPATIRRLRRYVSRCDATSLIDPHP